MKYHYETEILYKPMERDGFNLPSFVPPYEAITQNLTSFIDLEME